MNIFESPFSKNTCGLLDIPDGKSGGIQLMMVDKNDQSCNVKLLHTKETTVEAGTSFTTVSEKVSCSLSVNKFILYLDQPSSYSWILENSITINIYNFRTNVLLATKVIGKQDSLVRLGISKYKDKPSIVINQCDSNIDFDLDGNFVKIEIISMCDRNSSPCCDSLPTQVSVSGYANLCIPMNDFYIVPNYPPPTTTPKPYSSPLPTVSLLDDLAVKESSGIPYYVVDAHVSTSDGSDFSYSWERSEDNVRWYRITNLKTEHTETILALKEVKVKDYYYRLYFDSPQRTRSNVAFYNYPELVTTSTTTTTAAPLVHPNSPLSVQASGGGFRKVHLSWKEPSNKDDRAPVSGYRILANTIASTSAYSSNYAFKTEVSASTTGYFQPVSQAYDGIDLHYCVSAANFFGFSEVSCASAQTISNEPPTVGNFTVVTDDQNGVDGFFLNWSTGGYNEIYPLVSHRIKYRASGTSDAYTVLNYNIVDLPATEVKITGVFEDCKEFEFLVDAQSVIGYSTSPATGYALYGFLPHSPTNLSLELEEDPSTGGVYSLELGWTEPTDSGRCDINSYVYNYRIAGSQVWSLGVELSVDDLTPVTLNPNTYSIQTNTVASGSYEAKIAAITEIGTGIYAAISAATLVKLDFEDWIQNTGVIYPHYYHIENKSLYGSYANIVTHQPYEAESEADSPVNAADPLYGRAQAAKFGNYGFYTSSLGFDCPKQMHIYQSATTEALYPYKFAAINFYYTTIVNGSPPSVGNTKISLTNSSTTLNDEGDGETRSTLECWFKLPASGPDDTIDTTLTDTNMGIMGQLSEIDPAPINTGNFPLIEFDIKDGTDYSMGYPEYMSKEINLLGDYILGSGLRLKLEHDVRGGTSFGDWGWNETGGGGGWSAYVNSSLTLTAPHPNYINDTEWHHLAVVSSGNNLKLYVDGTGIIDSDYTCNIGATYDGGAEDYEVSNTGIDIPSYFGHLLVGTDINDALHYVTGLDDPASASTYCLNVDEVRLSKIVAYSGNFDVPTEPLI